MQGSRIQQMLEYVIQAIGYRAYVEKTYKQEFDSRWANVEGPRARARARAFPAAHQRADRGGGHIACDQPGHPSSTP